MANTKTCYVCNGTDTEDGGVENNGRWFCSSGCWSDYYVGMALKNHIESETKEKFIKNIKELKDD